MQKHLLITLLLSVFIALLGIGVIVPVMPVFATSVGAGGLALGLIISAFSITRGIFQPIVGYLSDRWGRKNFLVSGLFIYGLVGLALPKADSVTNLIVIRALHGIGSAMIIPVAMAYVSDLSAIGQEGRFMGMLNIAIFSGIGSGPLLGGFFIDIWGLAAAFYVMAGLSFIALLLVVLQMPVLENKNPGFRRTGIFEALGSMLGQKRTVGILLARMSTMIIMVPTMAFLPLLMDQWFQASGTQIGIVITCRTLVNALLQIPFGKIADLWDKVRFLEIGIVITSVVLTLVPLATNFWWLLILFVLLGTGEAIIWPTLGALAAEEGHYYGQGTMMGVYNLAMSSGVLIGSLTAGIIMDLIGLSWSFFLIGVIVLTLALAASSLIKNTTPTRVAPLSRPV
ncbi:MAG: MFS transporter [Thermodesulfobacteriota bacterium]